MDIKALDFDAIQIDKAIQLTVDGRASWASSTRQYANELGKTNFLVAGEVTVDAFGSLRPADFSADANAMASDDYGFRNRNFGGLDAVPFHYS
ncbi:hypothetical protein C0991_003354, partial [Blastosporella zonata]